MSDTDGEQFAQPTRAQLEAQRAEELRMRAELAGTADEQPEPEDEPEDESESEPEPEPQSRVLSEKDIERISKRIDQAAEANEKRLRSIMGEDFENLAPCPLCAVPGFAYKPGLIVIEPLHRAAIMAAIGEDSGPEYKHDPKTMTCPACDGHGDVLHGGKRENLKLKQCDACGGQGWVPKLDPGQQMTGGGGIVYTPQFSGSVLNAPPIQPAPAQPYPGYGIAFIPIEGGVPDGFNRPAGHPHYGMPREYSEQAV